ncbi:MAG: hypothetical protein GX060_04475 [Firmicutes bacterium]|nr:hypothetical protein [Bacillota bacterium]
MAGDDAAKKDLNSKVEELAYYLERMRLAEYIALFNRPWRLMWLNFLAGLARGVGIAIGGTILAALVIFLLSQLAILNLPVIGDFIAELVKIVQGQLAR